MNDSKIPLEPDLPLTDSCVSPAQAGMAQEAPAVADQATLPPRSVGAGGPNESPGDSTAARQPGDTQPKSVAASAACPRRFGDYELLSEVARGGMGVVYKARQLRLNRTVAIKMILTGQLASGEEVRRFFCEAEAAAAMQHPHIVAIHEVGEHEGQHFFSMDFVEGQNLAEMIRESPLSAERAARYVQAIGLAIQYAHEQGKLHRDLKPSNIIIDPQNQVRVTDFGLARSIECSSELTGTGQVLGTPSYMPPEQAAGRSGAIGPASDVYSLGAILYELLTGRPPFRAENALDTLMQVLEADPAPPKLLNPTIPDDLQTICLKCLEKDPRLRYTTARHLADDLGRYLAGEPISATTVNILGRMTRALARSANDEELHAWGLSLILIGVMIFTSHLAIWVLEALGQPLWLAYGIPRAAMVIGLLTILWRSRTQSILPTNATERLIWSIWIGYLTGYAAAMVVIGVERQDHLLIYPIAAILCGVCYFIMGSHIWGGSYLIGLSFLATATVMPLALPWSPLLFGTLWLTALGILGGRYLSLGKKRR
jgi:tRNA A-37 threonylcarbamoyl transferase component Bud32